LDAAAGPKRSLKHGRIEMSSLVPGDFAEDETILIACQNQEASVSERLFLRLVLIGAAYELHVLPLLREDCAINSVQAEALFDELAFVSSLVADDALASVLKRVMPLVNLAYRSGHDVKFEWP
jgi:hypothetical protein